MRTLTCMCTKLPMTAVKKVQTTNDGRSKQSNSINFFKPFHHNVLYILTYIYTVHNQNQLV